MCLCRKHTLQSAKKKLSAKKKTFFFYEIHDLNYIITSKIVRFLDFFVWNLNIFQIVNISYILR